jgi:hypothetical protein
MRLGSKLQGNETIRAHFMSKKKKRKERGKKIKKKNDI